MHLRISPISLALFLLLGAPSLRAQSVDGAAVATATLSPGDVIRIVVWRKPEFSGDFIVAPDSTITHPLYREVKVVGVPLHVVEDRVRVFLARYETNPAFVISPLLRVFVGGEVRLPNVYSLPPGTTVAQAVAVAGGPTDRGRLDQVLIVRRQDRQVLDLTRPESPSVLTETRSGDQVFVGRRLSFFNDVLAPASAVFAAVATVVSITIQLRR
jgi:protein involved in polysaccharide export with SLBB domain